MDINLEYPMIENFAYITDISTVPEVRVCIEN